MKKKLIKILLDPRRKATVTDPLGAELITNGDFSDATWTTQGSSSVPADWLKGGTLDNASNLVEESGAGDEARILSENTNNTYLRQNGILTATTDYRLTFDVVSITGTLRIRSDGLSTYDTTTGTGAKTFDITALDDGIIFSSNGGVLDCVIDNVSIKEIL